MDHLILTACLLGAPEVCAERLLPAPVPEQRAACIAGAPARIAAFVAAHPVRAGAWRCTAAAPTVALAEIAPGIWVHSAPTEPLSPDNRGAIANLAVIVTDRVTVIDAGGSREGGERLFAAIRGLTDAPIAAVVLTHGHPDHAYGAAVFAEAGAQVIAHAAYPDAVAARAATWAESIPRQIGAAPMIGAAMAMPDRVVAVPEDLDLGRGQTLRLTPEPTAHTSSDLTAFHPASGTFFTGDLVFHGLTPVLDGSLRGWLAWLDRAPPAGTVRIVPGHGAGPFSWEPGTAPVRAYLQGLAAETRAAIAQGLPMSEAVGVIGTDLEAMPDGTPWAGFADIHPRNATAAYAELEWE